MKTNKGFTLTELMIVVMVIALLGAIAAPNIIAMIPKWRLNGQIRTLSSLMQFARMKAISSNMNCYLDFAITGSVEDRFYTLYVDQNNNDAFDPGEEIASRAPLKDIDKQTGIRGISLPSGIRFGVEGPTAGPNGASIPDDGISFTNNRVRFTPRGTAFPSGTVYLTNGQDNYALTVLATTGRIRIWKWKQGDWQ